MTPRRLRVFGPTPVRSRTEAWWHHLERNERLHGGDTAKAAVVVLGGLIARATGVAATGTPVSVPNQQPRRSAEREL